LKKNYFIIFLLLLNLSCLLKEKSELKPLFSIKIGFGTNEIGGSFERLNNKMFKVTYKDGFFYILDPINNKIMKVTEKGEVIFILFNGLDNPHIKEVNLQKTETEDFVIYTKLYRNFKIIDPVLLEVDNKKNIYFINRDPEYKKMFENIGIKDQLILKFDSNGNFLNFIGTDGINSDPFSAITELKVDNGNNLIVKENLDDGIYIYKFSEDGKLLKKARLIKEDIPVLSSEMEYTVDFVDIKLSDFEDEVYVICQFIKSSIENFSIIRYETMYEKIFVYSLRSNKYEKILFKVNPEFMDLTKISENRTIKSLYGDNKMIMKPMKEFIGVDLDSNIYLKDSELPLTSAVFNKFSLNIYDFSGRNIRNIEVTYPEGIDYFSNFSVVKSGFVYSYYLKNGEIVFVKIK